MPTQKQLLAATSYLSAQGVGPEVVEGMLGVMRRGRNPAIAAAERELSDGSSLAAVRRKYRLSGSVVQRLARQRKEKTECT